MKFNQPIGEWDVSSVTNMIGMFDENPNFNQPIGNWEVKEVKNMKSMFSYAINFNQSLEKWDVSNVSNFEYFAFSCEEWIEEKPSFKNNAS